METNREPLNIRSTNKNIQLLFLSKPFRGLRFFVLTSAFCAITLLGSFGPVFNCILAVFQYLFIPLLGTLMYLDRTRYATISQRLKEAALVGGLIGGVVACVHVLITLYPFYLLNTRQNVYRVLGYNAPPFKWDVILVETQFWLAFIAVLVVISSFAGFMASILSSGNWQKAHAD